MINLAVIGFGNRARKYVSCLNSGVRVSGIVEPSADCRRLAVEQFGISAACCFDSFNALLASGVDVDAVIIASPDRTHFEYACRCLELGWPTMLEKPMATEPEECLKLAEFSRKTGVSLTVCYELRYHPFFVKLKELTENPKLGKLLSVEWISEVGLNRMMHSYVRGTWSREEETGPIALTKLCHDVDLLLWMIPAEPVSWKVNGSLEFFRSEIAPEGAAPRCIDCPLEKGCRFSAVDLYLRKRDWIKNFIVMPGESQEDMLHRVIKETDYGRCVFYCENNVNDTQDIHINYPDGLTATILMKFDKRNGEKRSRFVYENGEIISEAYKIYVRYADSEEIYDMSYLSGIPLHAGADKELVNDFIASLIEGRKTRSEVDEAVTSHIICMNYHN